MNATKAQVDAVKAIVLAVAETIRELGKVPSGHLYANLMGRMSLDDYKAIIQLLKDTKMVSESNHVLTWIGDK